MQLLSEPLRPRRPGEWSVGTAIHFVVTLAAKGSVTLAARSAGMSRKSAYALRKRDPLFARTWEAAATGVAATSSGQVHGNSTHLAEASTSSTARRDPGQPRRPFPLRPAWQGRLLAELSSTRRDSPFGGMLPRLAPRPASR